MRRDTLQTCGIVKVVQLAQDMSRETRLEIAELPRLVGGGLIGTVGNG